MLVTNKHNLPQSLVNAVTTERHNKEGSVSATTLLQGVKQIILTERHWDEIEDDVSDRVWALFGTAVHKLLEECNPNAFTEEKFEVERGPKTVTGQVDLYDMEEKTITDYKTASVWKIKFQNFDDWRRQGLIYSWLLKQEGLEVKRCRFIAMLRDWTKGEAQRNADYPQSQVYEYVFDVTEKDLSEIEIFINDKVLQIIENEKKSDDEIAPCTGEERWETETTWAIKKVGRKTALKVCHTKAEAEELLPKLGGTEIEERKGQSKRCTDYCLCNKFCNFYKEHCLKGEQE
jgi:DNA-binding Lrp family transcriptional regulator